MTLLDEAYERVLAEYGHKGYEFWRRLVGQNPIIIPHPNDSTKEIEISPRWDSVPNGPIRVLVSTLHTTRFGITLPTASFLVRSNNSIRVPKNRSQSDLCPQCGGAGDKVLGIRWRSANGTEQSSLIATEGASIATLLHRHLKDPVEWDYLYETCEVCGGTGKSKAR